MAATLVIETVLAPVDFVRRRALRALGAYARPLMRDRELRVALMATAVVVTAFATTMLAPLWMLALGPLVLGVPHVVADLRYVWVRPGYAERRALWIAAVPALLWGAATGRVV